MAAVRVEQIAGELIRYASVSSTSNVAVSEYAAELLAARGFDIERVGYRDAAGIEKLNIIARRGEGAGGIAYMAHTDVVPATDWCEGEAAAFEPILREGRLYGRGSCDMKGSIASALAAVDRLDRVPQVGPLYFVLTADEEIGMEGAQHVVNRSAMFAEMVAGGCVGIVGEPTRLRVVRAHKGTLLVTITSEGISAHSSSRIGVNANDALFAALPGLQRLREATEVDPRYLDHSFDPPTLSWNWVIRNEPFAFNVTPGLAELQIFLRPMPEADTLQLAARIREVAEAAGLRAKQSASHPPLSVDADSPLVSEMLRITATDTADSVCYATDACVLRLDQVIVCGPGDIAQAHRDDEWVAISQLDRAVEIYTAVFRRYCC